MYNHRRSFGNLVVGEVGKASAEIEKQRAEMDARLKAAQEKAAQDQAQNAAREAAFAAEVAKAAALVEVLNKWAEEGKKAGRYPSVSGKDGFKEIDPKVREAFLTLVGSGELGIKTDAKQKAYVVAGSSLPTVIGVTDKEGNYKFKPNEVVASGFVILLKEEYLGGPEKIGLMLTKDPEALVAASKDYAILAAPDALRAEAAMRLSERKKQQDALKKWNELWSMKTNTTAAKVNQVGSIVVGTAAIYHGYKRNESLGWALVWGILGGAFWPITAPVMLAQGFGKPKLK